MSITVVSATESPVEAKADAVSQIAEQKSAPAEEQGENTEVSEPSEATEEAELEAKDGDDAEEQAKEQPKGKKPGFIKRIDKLTRKNADLAREVEYLRQLALQKEQPKHTESRVEVKEAAGKPNPNDFDTHEAYVDALTDWKIDSREKAREAKSREQEIKTERQTQVEGYVAKVKEFAKQHEDFQDTLESVDHIPMSITVEQAILKHGPELAYELAKDADEFEKICMLNALDASEAIGEIRARMKSAAKSDSKTEQKLTKAPKPPTPIASKSAPVKKSLSDPNLSQREYERMRDEQEAKRAQ